MNTVYDKVSRVHRPLVVLLLSLMPVSASGLTSDRDQPVVIEADKATLNEKTGHSVYEGNVHLRQGTLVLQGDKMTVQLNQGTIQTVILSGTPATYRQRPEGDESDQHAEADKIEYYADKGRIVLQENARVWQADDQELRSDHIVFDLKSETVNAGSSKPGDRVRIILPPGSTQNKPPVSP